ncbi:hypothetical protein A7H1H_1330 [Aliarcobacter butzleri 7h1h]|uniref:hypothetical protein n=1 Tax=Aliarcobacter butzleri TaxID=28197 RepID=UPI00035B9ADF|nr:hypothetical protein [Aliarcobacter butzleri]RBQ31737.1 hypothetical protein CRU92_05865 [Arcobacter sp. FW59]AGR77620.1 hypothetical protein A7H1H_1330 [Aliarcobacter butzleri 7h1h]MCG3661189.1 hypothetical protein [Aliarcobacter butzleri]MCG3678400.1 hypothetical protein [Aliarcobacter butzleri]MCG3710998.1 hypothetical protein [Aliarcobacter butzleri]
MKIVLNFTKILLDFLEKINFRKINIFRIISILFLYISKFWELIAILEDKIKLRIEKEIFGFTNKWTQLLIMVLIYLAIIFIAYNL